MLYTSEDQKNKEKNPFDTRVVNDIGPVKCTGGQKALFIILCIFTLGIVYFVFNITKVNQLNALQNKINESASNIEVQLEKRYSTLTKLVQAVGSHTKFNKEVFENIAKYRSMGSADLNEKASLLNKISTGINATFENYPTLGADMSVQKLMTEISMIEKEIAASRRLYNANVNEFNTSIYNFPTNVVVAKKGYEALNLFSVEESHRQDVDVKF